MQGGHNYTLETPLLLWLPCIADADIIFLPCGFFFLSCSFFLAYSRPSQIGCLPYLHTWCGLSANLGCKSETRCMWLTENTGRKKSPNIHHLGTIGLLCRAISSQLKPWFNVKIKLFDRILVWHGTTSEMK